jgi:hypothetical protein
LPQPDSPVVKTGMNMPDSTMLSTKSKSPNGTNAFSLSGTVASADASF